jgi:hypothetical protein
MWIFFCAGGTDTYMVEFRGDESGEEVRSILKKSLGVTVSTEVHLPDISSARTGDRIDLTTGSAPIVPNAPLAEAPLSKSDIQFIVKHGFDEKTAQEALRDSHSDVKAAVQALMMRTHRVATAPEDRRMIRNLRTKFPNIPASVVQEVYQSCGKDTTMAETILSTR